jgi:hypothetical protein
MRLKSGTLVLVAMAILGLLFFGGLEIAKRWMAR